MINDISIMYITCNLYNKLWNPWIKNQKKYLLNKYKIFFCTDFINTKEYNIDNNINIIEYNIESDNSLHGNFYDRMLYYLNLINTDYILYNGDDFFISNPPDFNNLENLLKLMKSNINIKYSKLSHQSLPYSGNIISYNNYNYRQANNYDDTYVINLQPSIFKKDFLIELINFCKINNTFLGGNNSLEYFGGSLANEINKNFFKCVSNNYICLRPESEIISIYGNNGWGLVAAGILQLDKEYLKNEDIYIETDENNVIFNVNNNTYKKLGEQHKWRVKHLISDIN